MCKRIKRKSFLLIVICIALLPIWGIGTIKWVQAEETEEEHILSEEEYTQKFKETIALANLLLEDETFVNNKTYTAEQEVELQNIITSINQSSFLPTDYSEAMAFAKYIRSHMALDDRQQTSTWEMLCDGDTIGAYGKPKCYGNSENFVHAFRDLCVLADIPCFMIKNDDIPSKTIAMFYTDDTWRFLDVADKNATPVILSKVYTQFSSSFEPRMISFEYDVLDTSTVSTNYAAEIYIDQNAMKHASDENPATFLLYYDTDSNMVKMYNYGVLTDEYYYGANQKSDSNGVPPKGWVDAVVYDTEKKVTTTYKGYSLFGVVLRGRIKIDDIEYTMSRGSLKNIPYRYIAEEHEMTETEKQAYSKRRTELQNRIEKIAETLYQDESFIFDTKFTPEEEAFIQAAVDTATSREYLESKSIYLEAAEYTLPPKGEPLSDELKAFGILTYIREHVEYGGGWFSNSYHVLKSGYAICGGYCILMQDMCTLAGIPCFTLKCDTNDNFENRTFSDHGFNMLRLDGTWYYADPTNIPILRQKPPYITATFIFGYDTSNQQMIFVSSDAFFKEMYLPLPTGYFYDFDAKGELGIYYTNRDELIRNDTSGNDKAGFYGTDENGKLFYGNGFFTFEKLITKDGVEELWLYEGYMQQGSPLEGRTTIQGKEYNFDSSVWRDGDTYTCYAKQLLKKQYIISHLEFEPIPDQEYTGERICPVPVIKHDDKILTLGVDFSINYKDNIELTNDYCVYTSYKVEGMGDYTGEATRYFNIVKRDISNMEVTLSKQEYSWDWDAEKSYFVRPEISIALSKNDYAINYENNKSTGEGTIVITGKNHCYGTIRKPFQITKRTLDEKQFAIVSATGQELPDTYTASRTEPFSIQPEISIRWYNEDGTDYQTISSNDYTVTYKNTNKFGTATIQVQGLGNFSGTLEKTFTIEKKELINIAQCRNLNDTMQGKIDYSNTPKQYTATYTGEPVLPYIPGITYPIFDSSLISELEKDVDFIVTATNNINVGEGTITVQGIGNYTGTITTTFAILPKEIKEKDITLDKDKLIYNGTIQVPQVQIDNLTQGTDYEIIYQKQGTGEAFYETVEPIEAGYYFIGVKLLSNNYVFQDTMNVKDGYYRMVYEITKPYEIPEGIYTPKPTFSSGTQSGSTTTVAPTTTPISQPDNGDNTTNDNFTTQDAVQTTNTPNVTQQTGETTNPSTNPVTDSTDTNTPILTTPTDSSPKVAKVKKCKVTRKKKVLILTWQTASDAERYELQISTKKNFKGAKMVQIINTKTSYKASKLKSKKKYYIRIRAYKSYKDASGELQNVYSKWVTKSKKTK